MTPFLSPLSEGAVGGSSPPRSLFSKPPAGFRPIVGDPRSVEFTTWLPPKSSGNTAAQKAGIRYERKVINAFADTYGPSLRPHPAIAFRDDSGPRVAIPDALLRVGNSLVILEIKYSHTAFAWWQLRKLYEPLLYKLTRAPIFLVEVCKSYDPSVAFPEEHRLITGLEAHAFTKAPVHVVRFE